MRAVATTSRVFVTVALVAAGIGAACAQTALEGPLATPGETMIDTPPSAVGPKAVKPRKQHGAAKKTPGTSAHAAERQRHTDEPGAEGVAKRADPASPLSLGMKWNGSNDNAEQTRVQNYGGGAQGTGAEVGLKLHF